MRLSRTTRRFGSKAGWDVDDLHLAHGAVAATGLDENAGQRLDGNHLAVQFHEAFAFEDEVNLSQLLVVVRPCVFLISTMCSVAVGLSGLTKARREKPHGHGTASISSICAIM
jgi:hypothetical protein